MSNSEDQGQEPANLRFLRILVTVLTGVMICGLVVIVALFVIRFSGNSAPPLPETITLPDGAKAESFTVSGDWYGVVVDNGARFLIFDRPSGRLRQSIEIAPAPQ